LFDHYSGVSKRREINIDGSEGHREQPGRLKGIEHGSEAQRKRAGIVWGTFFADRCDFFDVRPLQGFVGIN
jgi:hypothetical protein